MAGGPGSYVLGAEERKEVLDVLDGGNLFRYGTPGVDGFQAKVVTFENEMAERLGHKHVVATSSGTGSLMCCLAALGIGMGDEVIVPGYTFIASIATIAMTNAIPVLAEIDESLTIDPTKIEALITPKTKAIMPVHMLGNPCDMDPIMEIAKKHNLYVIEDCCQAVGAAYHGKRVGTIGDMGAYSLNVFKTITTGDGGFVGTSSDELYERAFGFHDQGHKPCRMGVEVGNRSMVGRSSIRRPGPTTIRSTCPTGRMRSICSRRRTISWTARSTSPSASWIRAWAPAAASTSTRPKRRSTPPPSTSARSSRACKKSRRASK